VLAGAGRVLRFPFSSSRSLGGVCSTLDLVSARLVVLLLPTRVNERIEEEGKSRGAMTAQNSLGTGRQKGAVK